MPENKTAPIEHENEVKITGSTKVKKKNELSKFAGELISDDASHVKSYIVTQVLIPTLKDTIVKIIKNAVDIIFFGEPRSEKKRERDGIRPSYRAYYDDRDDRYDSRRSQDYGKAYYFEDVVFESKLDAEIVRDQLFECCERYNLARVADYYEFGRYKPEPADFNYGWLKLNDDNTRIVTTSRGEYIIKLPRAVPIV